MEQEPFENIRWKECPDDVRCGKEKKYSVHKESLNVATNFGGESCTIIGNTPLPLNTAVSWNTKVLKTRNNNGNGVYVGVAPSSINQNDNDNEKKCG